MVSIDKLRYLMGRRLIVLYRLRKSGMNVETAIAFWANRLRKLISI
jgi:hypothetical protein